MAAASRPPGGRPPGKKFFWSSPWSPFTWSCGPHAPSRVSSSASVLLVWTQSDEVCARHRQRSSKSATSTPGRALRNNVRMRVTSPWCLPRERTRALRQEGPWQRPWQPPRFPTTHDQHGLTRSIAIDHHRSFAVSSDQSAASSKLSIAFWPADQN